MGNEATQFKTGKQQVKIARKGGSKSTLAKSVCKMKNCSPKCRIYSKCRYIPLSEKMGGKCALNNKLNNRTRNRYINLLLGGEDDLIDEGINLLVGIKDESKALTGIEKIHKMRFGDKVVQEINTRINFFDEFNNKLDELKKKEKVKK